jgi:hypothetical protein
MLMHSRGGQMKRISMPRKRRQRLRWVMPRKWRVGETEAWIESCCGAPKGDAAFGPAGWETRKRDGIWWMMISRPVLTTQSVRLLILTPMSMTSEPDAEGTWASEHAARHGGLVLGAEWGMAWSVQKGRVHATGCKAAADSPCPYQQSRDEVEWKRLGSLGMGREGKNNVLSRCALHNMTPPIINARKYHFLIFDA